MKVHELFNKNDNNYVNTNKLVVVEGGVAKKLDDVLNEVIKVKSYSSIIDISAGAIGRITINTSVPNGYTLVGYIINGVYTDSTKSDFYVDVATNLVASRDSTARVYVKNNRTTNIVDGYLEIKGIYLKI